MTVSARFKVNRMTEMGWGTEVEMTPDYAGGRNKQWAAATPAGMCRLTINSESGSRAAAFFEQSKPVAIWFTDQDFREEELEKLQREHTEFLQTLYQAKEREQIEQVIRQVESYLPKLQKRLAELPE